ncbi:hypothetical protein JGI15_10131, partial [Candidatus Kryptonium thompsonii]
NDLGKYVFSLSIFWAYLWYSQFFIIWYGNIPEVVSYFFKRAHDYGVIFYGNIIANFGIPFFLLLSKKISSESYLSCWGIISHFGGALV